MVKLQMMFKTFTAYLTSNIFQIRVRNRTIFRSIRLWSMSFQHSLIGSFNSSILFVLFRYTFCFKTDQITYSRAFRSGLLGGKDLGENGFWNHLFQLLNCIKGVVSSGTILLEKVPPCAPCAFSKFLHIRN